MFDIINKVLSLSKGFCEVRINEKVTKNFQAKNGISNEALSSSKIGVGIRVIRNGAWGFASTSELTIESLEKTLRNAEIAAEKIGERSIRKVPNLPTSLLVKGDYFEEKLVAPKTDDLIGHVLKTESILKKQSPLLSMTSCTVKYMQDEKWIATTDGASVHKCNVYTDYYMLSVASKDNEMAMSMFTKGIQGYPNDVFCSVDIEQTTAKLAKITVDKISAPFVTGGMHIVILKPPMVGLLSHEAIGHTVEADFVMSGSIAAGKVGKKVASEMITLVDAGPAKVCGSSAVGCIEVDDEGIEAQETKIIENGIMKSYLHNRETAEIFGVEPTGNSRAWSHTDLPIIRMRNTYIESGKSSLEEMIEATKEGYLIDGAGNGQADSNAEFMFGCEEIYEIRDGKVGKLMKEATLSGQAFDVLSSVDMVGNDFRFDMGTGFCGKGQPAKVDGGGPSIRCQAMMGGK
jgi:TldD protein